MVKEDRQRELFEAVRSRMCAGEGLQGRFFKFSTTYLFVGDYRYWFMTPHAQIDLDATEEDFVLNRVRLYRDRRDFLIQQGDTGRPEDYPGPPHRTTPRRITERTVADSAQSNRADTKDRCRGTMVGLAVGNLLGIPFEGKPRRLVDQRFPEGVREIEALPGYPDDDDLAQAVILAAASMTSEALHVEDLVRRFWVWGEENGLGMGSLTREVLTCFGGASPQRMARNWVFFGGAKTHGARPVPRPSAGRPTLDAARQVWVESGKKAAGNGAVMRCAPVAIRWMYDETELVRNTVASAVATHYDPRCVWSSIVVNLSIATLLKGVEVDSSDLIPRGRSAMETIGAALAPFGNSEDTLDAPAEVQDAIRCTPGPDLSAMSLDGGDMGYTLKAMQVALWCAREAKDFEEALITVVSAGGDTDTNGAVAGAVLGARFGSGAIPSRWKERVATLRAGRVPMEDWADLVLAAATKQQHIPDAPGR
jgi:ADP-ribosylglycohydrolase